MMDGNTYDVKNLSAILDLLLGYWQSILENAIRQNLLDKTRIIWRYERECYVMYIIFVFFYETQEFAWTCHITTLANINEVRSFAYTKWLEARKQQFSLIRINTRFARWEFLHHGLDGSTKTKKNLNLIKLFQINCDA